MLNVIRNRLGEASTIKFMRETRMLAYVAGTNETHAGCVISNYNSLDMCHNCRFTSECERVQQEHPKVARLVSCYDKHFGTTGCQHCNQLGFCIACAEREDSNERVK